MKAKEKPFKTVAAQVRFYLDLNDRNISWLAKAMGISQSCLYGKMSDPQKFTLGDLEKISKVFKVDTEKFGVTI